MTVNSCTSNYVLTIWCTNVQNKTICMLVFCWICYVYILFLFLRCCKPLYWSYLQASLFIRRWAEALNIKGRWAKEKSFCAVLSDKPWLWLTADSLCVSGCWRLSVRCGLWSGKDPFCVRVCQQNVKLQSGKAFECYSDSPLSVYGSSDCDSLYCFFHLTERPDWPEFVWFFAS